MIVISGALVLVALVLLIFGITTTDLDFVYASIVVSLVSFVFLLIGILQRRGDRGAEASAAPATAEKGAPAGAEQEQPDEGVTAVVPRRRAEAPARGSARSEEPVEEPQTEELELVDDDEEYDDDELVGGTVLVVPGRPRYHVAGCRYLTGKSATEVDVLDARDEGFSPCGVCKPDDALAAEEDVAEEDVVEEDVVEEPVVEEEPEPVAAAAPARRSRSTAAAKKAPAKRAPRPARTRSEPSPAAVAAADPAADAVTDPVLEAVASEAPPASPAAAASDGASAAPAKASRRTGNVVVIPDRGKFHRAECRYVRNADDTSTMSRTAATRQGYDACGVCKP